jgi:hypothetical protein
LRDGELDRFCAGVGFDDAAVGEAFCERFQCVELGAARVIDRGQDQIVCKWEKYFRDLVEFLVAHRAEDQC